MSDGASAMLIADRATAEALGLPVRARFVSFGVGAEDAVLVLSAPNPVTRRLLARTGHDRRPVRQHRVQRGLRRRRPAVGRRVPARRRLLPVQPRGGAIAIGHPLGASGVRLATTLLGDLEATGGRYGFMTMCEGGGQANATVIERLG